MASQNLRWEEFERVDIRTATILDAEVFPEARNPSYKLKLDFGPLGIKKSSAQITGLYKPEDLVGKQVVAVVNFPPRQIANMMSEVLILGAPDDQGRVVLLQTERLSPNGLRIS